MAEFKLTPDELVFAEHAAIAIYSGTKVGVDSYKEVWRQAAGLALARSEVIEEVKEVDRGKSSSQAVDSRDA